VTDRRADARKRRRKARGRDGVTGESPPTSWKYWVGRFLQVLGLLILPFGIASELMGKVGLGQSLLVAAGGALAFYVGFLLQQAAGAGRV
jgi:hypothetical protein